MQGSGQLVAGMSLSAVGGMCKPRESGHLPQSCLADVCVVGILLETFIQTVQGELKLGARAVSHKGCSWHLEVL